MLLESDFLQHSSLCIFQVFFFLFFFLFCQLVVALIITLALVFFCWWGRTDISELAILTSSCKHITPKGQELFCSVQEDAPQRSTQIPSSGSEDSLVRVDLFYGSQLVDQSLVLMLQRLHAVFQTFQVLFFLPSTLPGCLPVLHQADFPLLGCVL